MNIHDREPWAIKTSIGLDKTVHKLIRIFVNNDRGLLIIVGNILELWILVNIETNWSESQTRQW